MRATLEWIALIFCLTAAAAVPCRPQARSDPAARFEQAQRVLAAGSVDEAIAIFQELVAMDKTSAPSWTGLGVAFYQKGDYSNAAAALGAALKIPPKMPAAEAFLGLSQAALGRSDASIALLASAFQSPDPAVQGELKRLVGIQLARAYSRQNRPKEAESVFQVLLDAFPEDADVLYHSFWIYLTRGRESLRTLVRNAPGSYRTHQLLGYLMLDKENYAAATEQFRLAIRANPGAKGIHYELGTILLATGNGSLESRQGAEREFQEELRLNAEHAPTYLRLAELAADGQQFDRAAQLYRKSAELDSRDAAPLVGLCKLAMQQEKKRGRAGTLQTSYASRSHKPQRSFPPGAAL